MNIIILSLIIDFFVMLSILPNLNYFMAIVFFIMCIFWLMSLFGSIFYFNTKNRTFGMVGIIGFALYIPIGFIGAVALMKLMDEDRKKEALK